MAASLTSARSQSLEVLSSKLVELKLASTNANTGSGSGMVSNHSTFRHSKPDKFVGEPGETGHDIRAYVEAMNQWFDAHVPPLSEKDKINTVMMNMSAENVLILRTSVEGQSEEIRTEYLYGPFMDYIIKEFTSDNNFQHNLISALKFLEIAKGAVSLEAVFPLVL